MTPSGGRGDRFDLPNESDPAGTKFLVTERARTSH